MSADCRSAFVADFTSALPSSAFILLPWGPDISEMVAMSYSRYRGFSFGWTSKGYSESVRTTTHQKIHIYIYKSMMLTPRYRAVLIYRGYSLWDVEDASSEGLRKRIRMVCKRQPKHISMMLTLKYQGMLIHRGCLPRDVEDTSSGGLRKCIPKSLEDVCLLWNIM